MEFDRSNHNPGALLNNDNEALLQYKKLKERHKRIDHIEDRLNNIEELLMRLLEK